MITETHLRRALSIAEKTLQLVLQSDMAQREKDEGRVSETLDIVRDARELILDVLK